MSALARDFSVTFGGVERLFGTLAGSAALLSWVLKVIPLTVSELITRLVEAYRALIHPAMEALLGLLPFDLPNWWNDVAALYIVAGGAVSRTLWVFYKDHREAEGENYGPAFVGRFKRRATQTLAVILSIPFWPLSLIAMLATPYVMRNPKTRNVFAGNRARYSTWQARKHYQYVCNLRTVFVLQMVAIVSLTAAAILIEF